MEKGDPMFDTVLLRSFVAVVQEGGFTHAAARLNLTQSAVSAHLRRLEKQTGRDLLARTTRSVTLTADGELLLGYARAILALNPVIGTTAGVWTMTEPPRLQGDWSLPSGQVIRTGTPNSTTSGFALCRISHVRFAAPPVIAPSHLQSGPDLCYVTPAKVKAKCPIVETHYPFDEDNVREFAEFLRLCGGFRIC